MNNDIIALLSCVFYFILGFTLGRHWDKWRRLL